MKAFTVTLNGSAMDWIHPADVYRLLVNGGVDEHWASRELEVQLAQAPADSGDAPDRISTLQDTLDQALGLLEMCVREHPIVLGDVKLRERILDFLAV